MSGFWGIPKYYKLYLCTARVYMCVFIKLIFHCLLKLRVCIMFSIIIVECHMSNTIPHVIRKPNMVMGQRSLIMFLSYKVKGHLS